MAKQKKADTLRLSSIELSRALKALRPALGSGSIAAAFRSYLFTELDGQLAIVASNQEVYAAYRMGTEPPAKTFSVDAEKLQLSVSVAKADTCDLTLRVEDKFYSGDFKSGSFDSVLVAYPGEDYPKFWSDADAQVPTVASIPGKRFDEVAPMLLSCVSTDGVVHPALANIELLNSEGVLYAISADNARIVRVKIGEVSGEMKDVLVLPDTIRLLSQAEGDVAVSIGASAASFQRGPLSVFQVLIAIPYPNVEAILSFQEGQDTMAKVEVNRAELASALKTMASFAGKNSPTVEVLVEEHSLKLQAMSDEGHSAHQTLDASTISDNGHKLFVNPYLLGAMTAAIPGNLLAFEAKPTALFINQPESGTRGLFATQTR